MPFVPGAVGVAVLQAADEREGRALVLAGHAELQGGVIVEQLGAFADLAKLVAGEAAMDNARDATQIFGGYGFMNEYRVARAWRDARVTKIWAGTNEIMKELIGRDLGL